MVIETGTVDDFKRCVLSRLYPVKLACGHYSICISMPAFSIGNIDQYLERYGHRKHRCYECNQIGFITHHWKDFDK